jgi:hypothetical protein
MEIVHMSIKLKHIERSEQQELSRIMTLLFSGKNCYFINKFLTNWLLCVNEVTTNGNVQRINGKK